MVKTLELAMSKAANLPEAAQEQLGRELLERIDALNYTPKSKSVSRSWMQDWERS